MSGPSSLKIGRHIPRGLTKFNEIIVARGKGCQVWDAQGRQFLDLTAGIGALSTGHCHPKVVSEVQQQAASLQMGQQNCFLSHPQHQKMVDQLLTVMPLPQRVKEATSFPHLLKPDVKLADVKKGQQEGAAVNVRVPQVPQTGPVQVGPYATIPVASASSSRGFSSSMTDMTNAQAAASSVVSGNYNGLSQSQSEEPEHRQMFQNIGNVPLDTFFFTNCGSECTDNAIKIARMGTGKPNIISVKGGFHGRTLAASSITASKVSYRYGFQPLMPGCFVSGMNKASFADLLYSQTGPGETAAVILEPIQGEVGVRMADVQFLRYLRKTCTENNIMLIFDEVQSGVGRAGKMWACEWSGVVPDIMTFAKGISSGYPMGGVAVSHVHTDRMSPNSMGGTGGGNPVCLAAANATLEVLSEEELIDGANKKGLYLREGVESVKGTLEREGFPIIQDVRQYGLFCAIDLDVGMANVLEVIGAAVENNLVLMSCGKNSLRVIPPLVVTLPELDFFFENLEKTLRAFKK